MKQNPVDWAVSRNLIAYERAISYMETRARSIYDGKANELVWLLEHPPIYTAGTSAVDDDLIDKDRFEVFKTGRGGEFTYHGPGQRVAYVMLNVAKRGQDVRAFVKLLQYWIIQTLACYSVIGNIRENRVGVWVKRPKLGDEREDKIAALGIRLKRWVSYHGISLNVSPNLEHFSGITPCGINHPNFGVTSLKELGIDITLTEIDLSLRKTFEEVFQTPTRTLGAESIPLTEE